MSDQSPSRFLDKIIIRVPEGMRSRIKRAADANGRSVNAELMVLLEKMYPPETDADELFRQIAEIVMNSPPEDRSEIWRRMFEKLDVLRNDAT